MRKGIFFALIFVFFLAHESTESLAKEAALELESIETQSQVREVSGKLRCLVCQNQSIADSSAPLAKDLRNAVIDQVKSGKKTQEIIDFMVARYGDFVVYEPPLKPSTLLLWFGPIFFLFMALFGFVHAQKKNRTKDKELSAEQKERAMELLINEGIK